MQQQTFYRRMIAVTLFAVALMVMLRAATAQGAQSILTAKLLDASGQPIKNADAILAIDYENAGEANYAGRWKPATNGSVTFTTDDVTCRPSDSADPWTARPSSEAISPITRAMNGALMRPTRKVFMEIAPFRRTRKISGLIPP